MSVSGEWMGDRLVGQVRQAAASGLLSGADVVKEASVAQAPRETGELAGSAYTGVDSSSLIAIVGYDVPRDIKAIKQHEDLSYSHPRGGGPKFLEKPLRASSSAVQSEVANALRRVMT
jgi:hypothetical protein